MNESEAQKLAGTLRQLGIRGIVSPENLNNPDGSWRVYDSGDPSNRRDITDEVRAIIAGASRQGGPARGFVIPTSH